MITKTKSAFDRRTVTVTGHLRVIKNPLTVLFVYEIPLNVDFHKFIYS